MHYMQIQISRVEDQKISKFLVAAGPLGDAITGVQPGGGGEAEEDDGGEPSHPQVLFIGLSWLVQLLRSGEGQNSKGIKSLLVVMIIMIVAGNVWGLGVCDYHQFILIMRRRE